MDRWLRFKPSIEVLWERDLGSDRVADLRRSIIVGLFLFNAFLIRDFFFLSDLILESAMSRVVLSTPVSLFILWILPKVGPVWRERVVAMGMVSAVLAVAPIFTLSRAPWALFSFAGYLWFVIYANMLLALRFRQASLVTALCFLIGVGSLVARGTDELAITLGLTCQYATTCLFSLYANYLNERRRTKSYLTELSATLKSEFDVQARQRYQDLSLTDALTDMPNRRLLNSVLQDWSTERAAVTIAMLDVDHFKLFNDALGHPTGDECLRQIARVLTATHSKHVMAARFGGEEFTIVIRDHAEPDAVRMIDDVLKAVEAMGISHPGRRDATNVVTISAGIASCPAGEDWTGDDLIASADAALYVAKRGGRNRFALAVGG
ncbi:hypothetical protein ASG43_06890 [Aureimonas sp. Leaf454]|nr:hypothetical protein ASG43_06890 [Aureimonas sp. Leaf454]